MLFNRSRRRRNAGPKLQDPGKVERKAIVDPVERIAVLKNAGMDLTIQLSRQGSSGDGSMKQQLHISHFNPLTFVQWVEEECGPGDYQIRFRLPDGTLYREEGSEHPETHILPIAGERKKPKSTEAKAAKAAKQGTENVEMYRMIIEMQKADKEMQQKDKEMLMQHILTAQSGDGGFESAFGIFQKGLETGQQIHRGGAPVTVGGNKSGIFANLAEGATTAFLNQLGLTPQGAPATGLPPAADSKVIAMPQQGAPGAGFAGASPGQQSAPNPQVAFSAPDPTGQGALTPQQIAELAIGKLKVLFQKGALPELIASEFVDTVCLCEGAPCVNGQWQISIADPAATFDKWSSVIPEFQINPDFTALCRKHFINIITEDRSREEQAEEPEVTETDEVHDSEMAREPSDEPETTEDDSRPPDSGNDEGTDQESQIDG